MNTEKKRKQIIGTMKKCFEQLGMPNLRHESAIALPNAEGDNGGHLVCSGIRFRYEEDYYSRAMVDMIIHERYPSLQSGSSPEIAKPHKHGPGMRSLLHSAGNQLTGFPHQPLRAWREASTKQIQVKASSAVIR